MVDVGHIIFQGWAPLLRTAIGTTITYIALVVLLRLAGPRTLAKWYAFDLIVTVALGSTFANSVLSGDISVAQSLVGFVILIGLQFIIAFAVAHWSPLRVIVNPQPTLLLHQGKLARDAMRSQRVAEADVRAAVRQHGIDRLEDVGAVVLEADGTFSVIRQLGSEASALADIPELGGSNAANRSD
ncbi:DUF421 domain-containing protein [Bradyrhizobium vignae]|uniref:DUF421 domain-containing protein n=1 Tax=Bradyrhizobium vignae TaxID=1549949 RepID=A0ABS4A6J6_9BRAD|nr:YetF domain-containing protein [Bradyrhizobium vignae]MBP0116033.1 DUF421 domain-containing protein [Bradyrhizobium vignae]